MMLIDATWYTPPKGQIKQRTSAGGVVVRLEEGKVLVALGTQDGRRDYVLPKGGVEQGETLEEAARREIAEEAGFTDLTRLAELGSRQRFNGAKTRWVTQHFFLFYTHQVNVFPDDAHRHGPPVWFDIDQLPPMCWPEQRELIQSHRDQIVQLACRHAQSH